MITFMFFQKTETDGNNIIIRNTVSEGMRIFHPLSPLDSITNCGTTFTLNSVSYFINYFSYKF